MEFRKSVKKDYLNELKRVHQLIDTQIEERLEEFGRIWRYGGSEDVLVELLFCILTPQSNAHRCWSIISDLKGQGNIMTIGRDELAHVLGKGARFKNNKSRYFVDARTMFTEGPDIKTVLEGFTDPCQARTWLVDNIKGIGYKEASHFLRNIGWGSDMAILDRHILRNLVSGGALEDIPKSMGPRKYCEIESKMKEFSDKVGIPMDHLDLLFWYMEKGEIFK
ncbi:MAG TPA: N-glycosylase/DNA lyase [Candidatus Methanofastidiosa archaeon]|nr:N-glycosylase/DNA lyase [Candidatus Methanofastidiosa archaeon]HPR41393.1 N-glycosylase/DNA lyase [Candidatus Methanofastidiosa archaeon]